MTAGDNLGVKIWHFIYIADDAVGGAVPSGTVLYQHAHARIAPVAPTTPLLEQGVETNKLYRAIIDGRDIQIQEQDVVEITSPVIHFEYGKKYRALAVQRQSFAPNDRRQYLIVTMSRIEQAHGNEYQ